MRGVNLVADILGDGSLSEIARGFWAALQQINLPYSYVEALYPYQMYRTAEVQDPRYQQLPRNGHQFPLNLLFYNLHIFESVTDESLKTMTQGKYTLAHWVWEMPQMPPAWAAQFERVDEVWCASSFIKGIFQQYTDKPIRVLSYPIMPPAELNLTRADLGLPDNRMVFLFTFSAGSGDGRKNPWGVIEAFRRAFGDQLQAADAPLLVLKTQHSADYPDLIRALYASVEAVNGLVISQSYTRHQMDNLLSLADVYVSLHRAEGFGLGMAEAMNLGRPVIATRYSGNLEYMNDEVAYLVDYHLRPVQKADHKYRPELIDLYYEGLEWAEADLDQAAQIMRSLYEQPQKGQEMGQAAAAHIQAHFTVPPVAQRLLLALEATFRKLDI